MIRGLITGELVADPQERTARNGSTFALCRVSVPQGDAGRIYCSVICFDDSAVARLLQLKAGASVSMAGTLKVSIWTPDNGGAPRPQLDLQADEIAATTPRPKKPRETRHADRDPSVAWMEA